MTTGNAKDRDSRPSDAVPPHKHPNDDEPTVGWKWMAAVDRILHTLTGHDRRCVDSFDGFVHRCMYRPVDGASLAVARILFGLAMLIDIPEERGGGDLDLRWGEPRDCRFPLILSMEPPALPRMGLIYGLMWLGAAGMMLGYRYRLSASLFTGTYWYVFLLDKSAWNNHSYLYGLLGVLFLFTDANRCWSIDAWREPYPDDTVPFWNYFILKFQFFVLYFIAGLKKLCHEWLSGYAMTNLSYHWVFAPFRVVIGAKLTDLLIVHWFGCLFDTSIVFFLIYGPTRRIATVFASLFHLMNSRLFHIGMFPWVCLTQLPLYYSVSWPRRIVLSNTFANNPGKAATEPGLVESVGIGAFSNEKMNHQRSRRRWTMMTMLAYCSLQLFLPYSHFLTQGYNNWTNGLYGYSWDMMVHAWDTIMIGIRVEDRDGHAPSTGPVLYVEPYAFTDNDRWTKHADMAVQFARCIERNIHRERQTKPNISIYFDIWCSMNGRFQQRIFHPHEDILHAPWSPFQPVPWVLPLLNEFNGLRDTVMRRITETVLSWSNYTDVLFIADFPGLTLHNYVASELYNVTLTVLNGTVRFAMAIDDEMLDAVEPGPPVILGPGGTTPVLSGHFHAIETLGEEPSCFMYTFVNRTKELADLKGAPVKDERSAPMLPLCEEFLHRWENFVRFVQHVGNSVLFELYGVPMPRRLKELVLDGG